MRKFNFGGSKSWNRAYLDPKASSESAKLPGAGPISSRSSFRKPAATPAHPLRNRVAILPFSGLFKHSMYLFRTLGIYFGNPQVFIEIRKNDVDMLSIRSNERIATRSYEPRESSVSMPLIAMTRSPSSTHMPESPKTYGRFAFFCSYHGLQRCRGS